MKLHAILIAMACVLCLSCSPPVTAQAAETIQPITVAIDGAAEGRTFEGIGALSAGASSRLLIDYPKRQRDAILDFLFKPNFGASLHDLKVEIGGEVNSTDGAEPSHARSREELDHPKPEYFARGYEWWLMEEAKKRNPIIAIGSLQWGAPGWIGNGVFTSKDNIDYIIAFIKGARDYHGVTIDNQGLWNEIVAGYKIPWTKDLRNALDRNGLQDVKLIIGDLVGKGGWMVVKGLEKDPALSRAVYAVGTHYPEYESPDTAKQLGKPLWASEDGCWQWTEVPTNSAMCLARRYNRNYVQGKMTKTIIWSPVTSYYDCLLLPNSGLMKANSPWSGHFVVPPAIWATAHTTQFAQPGWKYIDSGCKLLEGIGSCVTLRKPNSGDYSIVIETSDAPESAPSHPVRFEVKGLSTKALHVWLTNKREEFTRVADITPTNGAFAIDLDGQTLYTLTTTAGQRKARVACPEEKPFPFPYGDGFERYRPGTQARYLSDICGAFEVAARADGRGKCLRQMSLGRGIEWFLKQNHPWTIVGSVDWADYEVSCDVLVEKPGFAAIYGRISERDEVVPGYGLKIDREGKWELCAGARSMASGNVASTPGQWHNLRLAMVGQQVTAYIDGRKLVSVHDHEIPCGMAALGSDFQYASFDNFSVRPIRASASEPLCRNLALGAKASASSLWTAEYHAGQAVDGKLDTRWNSASGTSAGEWLEVDFGTPTTFNAVAVKQFLNRIKSCTIQYLDGSEWKNSYVRSDAATLRWSAEFPAVTSSKVRLLVNTTDGQTPTIWEFEVYNCPRREKATTD